MTVTNLSFSAAVDAWVRESEARMTAVFRESTQRVVAEMVANTPVDTGFLRSSVTVTTAAPAPIDPKSQGAPGQAYTATTAYILTIAAAKLGDTIFACFTASYAAFVEFGTSRMAPRAMVRLAAQRWSSIVAQVAAEAKNRASGG